MAYNPFAAINLVTQYYDRGSRGARAAFVQLEALLKPLALPECDTIPVKNIVLTDSVAVSDDGDLIIAGLQKRYALRGDGAHPIAATATPIAVGDGLDRFAADMTFLICFRQINDTAEAGVLLTLIDSVTDEKLAEFGYKSWNTLYLKANDVETLTEAFEGSSPMNQFPMSVGWCQDAMSEKTHFFCNGQVLALQSNTGKLPVFPVEGNPCHLRFGDELDGEIYWAGFERKLIYPPESYHTPPPLEGGMQYGRDWIAFWRFNAGAGNIIANICNDAPSANYELTKDATATWVEVI